jgi:hypothetical protein
MLIQLLVSHLAHTLVNVFVVQLRVMHLPCCLNEVADNGGVTIGRRFVQSSAPGLQPSVDKMDGFNTKERLTLSLESALSKAAR